MLATTPPNRLSRAPFSGRFTVTARAVLSFAVMTVASRGRTAFLQALCSRNRKVEPIVWVTHTDARLAFRLRSAV
jgi:hypothetical protein